MSSSKSGIRTSPTDPIRGTTKGLVSRDHRAYFGPLQDMAVTGSMTWKLTEASGKTTIEMTYKVGGYGPEGAR